MATESKRPLSDDPLPTEEIPRIFETILEKDVPKGREGKHKRIVTQLLKDIDHLKAGQALKVPLDALPDSKENVRSALNRATRQKGILIETSSDSDYLYIWKNTRSK